VLAEKDKERKMNLKKERLVIALAVTMAWTMTVCTVFGQNAQDKQSSASNAHEKTLVGVWRTVVSPRDCQTGAPLGSLRGLFTFNEGGTMAEYGIPPGSSPALRSPGHGLWRHEHGWEGYSLVFTYYRYNAGGGFIGSQKVTAALELGASGNEFTTSSAVQVFDANDNPIGSGCATAAGTRFE
jgi:hypothetical protein